MCLDQGNLYQCIMVECLQRLEIVLMNFLCRCAIFIFFCITFPEISRTVITVESPTSPVTIGSTYRAAVYEHVPYRELTEGLRDYEKTAYKASAQGSDILVFPEYGLLSLQPKSRALLKALSRELPVINENLCTVTELELILTFHSVDITTAMSCIAKFHGIYVAFNFCAYRTCSIEQNQDCPEDGFYLYNTNFVYNDVGTIVAVYRKFHLFEEPYFNSPESQDISIFHTSFGTFGTFTCFDIIFGDVVALVQEYKVTNFIYPTYWIDSYPLYVSIDVQRTWASSFKVNLLAANLHWPMHGALGSGIYLGVKGAITYAYKPNKNESELLIADLGVSSIDDAQTKVEKVKHFMFETNIENINSTKVNKFSGTAFSSQKGVECYLEYTFNTENPKDQYFFGALNGSLHSDDKKHSWSVELCILYICKDRICTAFSTSVSNGFRHLKLNGTFSTSVVLPSVLLSNFKLPDYNEWEINEKQIKMRKDKVQPVLYAALCGRNYKLDKP